MNNGQFSVILPKLVGNEMQAEWVAVDKDNGTEAVLKKVKVVIEIIDEKSQYMCMRFADKGQLSVFGFSEILFKEGYFSVYNGKLILRVPI